MARIRLALLGLYPISGVATGGAEKVCCQLASVLARREDLDVHVICPDRGASADRGFDRGSVHVHAIGCKKPVPMGVYHYLGLRKRVVNLIDDLSPDVAHAQDPAYGLWAAEAGIPTVTTVHGMYGREAAFIRGARRLMARVHLRSFRKALRKARFLISINPYVQEELGACTDAAFFPIANPVNPRFFDLDPDRAQAGRVLYVGLLIRRKCVLELLQAFGSVWHDHPRARLCLVGDRRDEAYPRRLREYVAEAGLGDAVSFLGTVSEEQLLQEYERAAMVVLMTRQETAPGSIAEAMAAGKAVVSTRVCGIPYMVDEGETGLLAEVDDVEGFAARMARLLQDPGLCRRMGQRGREKALREFHPDRVAEETVKVYRRVVDEW